MAEGKGGIKETKPISVEQKKINDKNAADARAFRLAEEARREARLAGIAASNARIEAEKRQSGGGAAAGQEHKDVADLVQAVKDKKKDPYYARIVASWRGQSPNDPALEKAKQRTAFGEEGK